MDEKTLLIYNTCCDFMKQDKINREICTFNLNLRKSIIINEDIIVTPIIADHSSYNACVFLIECDGKRLLHTGDFRGHGRKEKCVEEMLKDISNVDTLIIEGTTLSREEIKYITESELENKAIEVFKKYDQIFILQSSTNIDRTVTFCRSAIRTNKKFVLDLLSATLVKQLDINIKIDNEKVFVWEPIKYLKKSQEFKDKYMVNERSYKFLPNYVMQVKMSMLPDIEKLKDKGLITNACLIYSMWDGYIERGSNTEKFIDDVKNLGMDFYKLHTSGHADTEILKMVESDLNPDKTIVIHTEKNNNGKQIFKHYIEAKDNEEIII